MYKIVATCCCHIVYSTDSIQFITIIQTTKTNSLFVCPSICLSVSSFCLTMRFTWLIGACKTITYLLAEVLLLQSNAACIVCLLACLLTLQQSVRIFPDTLTSFYSHKLTNNYSCFISLVLFYELRLVLLIYRHGASIVATSYNNQWMQSPSWKWY